LCHSSSASIQREQPPKQKGTKKEKQGLRLASFAPVLTPFALLPKPGFGNLEKRLVNFSGVVDIKFAEKNRFLNICFDLEPIWVTYNQKLSKRVMT
jgi:hypothetical protein